MSLIRPATFILISFLTASQAYGLNILLTNDDGYDHPWLKALHGQLAEAGHRVTLVAPAENQSGRSAALTLSDVQIDNPAEDVYAIHSTPATAVLTGLEKIVDQQPDLVISGPNYGANIGVLSSFSGTVGATVAVLHLADEPVPAIAISGNPLDREMGAGEEPNASQGKDIARFTVDLVAGLEDNRAPGAPLLPAGIALNVNYPALPGEEVKGVGVFRHGRDIQSLFNRMKEAETPGAKTDNGGALATVEDTQAMAAGHITIVPIDGDYTAADWRNLLPAEFIDQLSATAVKRYSATGE